jgi:Fur family ferric uptake transcriptional regulator
MNWKQSEMACALHQAGYRLTQPRLAVLQVLQENDESLNPEEIHQRAQEIYAPLGLVTVYRTLDILDELNLVRRVHSEQRCHSYASAGAKRHYLVCRNCHRVIEFPCDGLDGLIEDLGQRTGYRITDHLLELSGLCPECQAGPGAGETAGEDTPYVHVG